MPINLSITWKVLASILGVIGTVGGAIVYITWEIRKDYIEDLKSQIAVYTQAESWKLPDTLKKLNSVSEKLQSQLSASDEIKKLKLQITASELEQAKAKIAAAEAIEKSENLSKSVSTLKQELRKGLSESTQFTLREGQTAELVKNRVRFGMSSIGSGYIAGNVNNDRISLSLANSFPIMVNDEPCTISLLQTSNYLTATISFSCPNPS